MHFLITRQREYQITLEAKDQDDLVKKLKAIDWENDDRAEWIGEGRGAEELDMYCLACNTTFNSLQERFCRKCGQARFYE